MRVSSEPGQACATHQARTEVARDVLLTNGHQAPEGLLSRHVHQQDGGNWGLGLAVAVLGVVDRVGLQHAEQVRLAARGKAQYEVL